MEQNHHEMKKEENCFDILAGHLFACGTPFVNTFIKGENIKKDLEHLRITADDLFSMFTANIIKQSTQFTR